MENTITADLLKRYFAGNCTPAGDTLVEAWLDSHPDNAKQAMQWMEQHQQEDALFAELMKAKNEVWEKTAENLLQPASTTDKAYPVSSQATQKVRSYRLQAAAVVAIILVIPFAIHSYWKHKLVSVETKYGQVQSIKLPDGSVVQLNGNSKIAYKQTWREKDREVWLDGEAFFTITHQQNHQTFTVHLSGQMDIEVLGTEFNVSDRTSGKVVALKSGKIKLTYQNNNQEENILMKPGELVETYENSPDIHKKVALNPQLYYDWTSGQWLLNGTTLEEMLLRLKETYGITTVVENKQLLKKQASLLPVAY